MKPKLSSNVILRVDEDMKSRLSLIQERTGCSISEIVRQCLSSLIEYYDNNNCLILPVAIMPRKDMSALPSEAKFADKGADKNLAG